MNRPFVTVNFAITADGRISTRNHTPADFSSKRDKYRLLEIRAACDAVLVSSRTVMNDRMTMGIPAAELRAERLAKGKPEYPHRIILTKSGQLDPKLPVFQKKLGPILIFSTERMPSAVRAALRKKATLHLDPNEVDLPQMMVTLYKEYGLRRVVCEGGAQILRALLTAGLVDELHVTLTPRIFGGRKAPTLTGLAGDFLPASTPLRLRDFRPEGDELFLRYSVAQAAA